MSLITSNPSPIISVNIRGTNVRCTKKEFYQARFTGKARETMIQQEKNEKMLYESNFKAIETNCKKCFKSLSAKFTELKIMISSMNSNIPDNYRLYIKINELRDFILKSKNIVTCEARTPENKKWYQKLDLLEIAFKNKLTQLDELKEQVNQNISNNRAVLRRMSL